MMLSTQYKDRIPKEIIAAIEAVILEWMDKKKHGYIQVNFKDGGVTNINLNESIRLKSTN